MLIQNKLRKNDNFISTLIESKSFKKQMKFTDVLENLGFWSNFFFNFYDFIR